MHASPASNLMEQAAPFHSTTSSMLCPVSGKTTTLCINQELSLAQFLEQKMCYIHHLGRRGRLAGAFHFLGSGWLTSCFCTNTPTGSDPLCLEKTLALPCFHFYVAVAQSTADACVIFCSCFASKMDPAKPIFVVKNLIG